MYLLSTWYVRYDMGKRYSVFYLLGVVASAFSGILAFGLMQMDGIANLGGWRYVALLCALLDQTTNKAQAGSSSSKEF